MSEKRQHFMREYDWIRRGLMFEPRGHDMMSGSILYPPSDPANDVGILFIETSGCLPMCGHGTIGTVTVAIEQGLVTPKTPGVLRLEVPAGLVLAEYRQEGRKVRSVKITNVASYLHTEGLEVHCDDLGPLLLDVAYGGHYYGIVGVQEHFKGLEHYRAEQLIAWAREIREKVNGQYPDRFIHPEKPHPFEVPVTSTDFTPSKTLTLISEPTSAMAAPRNSRTKRFGSHSGFVLTAPPAAFSLADLLLDIEAT